MLVKTILNRIHHFKGFVYKNVHFDNCGRLIIEVENRRNSKAKCSKCQKSCSCYDHLSSRLFAFIPLWNIQVFLQYTPRRVSCKQHGFVVEHIPWAKGKCHLCNCFRSFLAQWARLLSWKQVAERFQVSWDSVYESIKHVVDYGLSHRNMNNIEAIGVDEIAIGKGHNYATVVYQIDPGNRRLLWIGKERLKRCFVFLRTLEKSAARKFGLFVLICGNHT